LRKIRRTPPTEGEDRLTSFLASLRAEDLSPRTVDGYRLDLLAVSRWYRESRGTELRWEALASTDLISYRQHLASVERLRPATVNRRLQALRRFCHWAQEHKILKADPGEAVKSVRVTQRGRPHGLEEPEVHALLRVAGESGHGHARRNYALVQFLLQTGLRISEAAALCFADLKLRERSGSVRVRQGKGRKEREVPLNASARRALRAYLEPRGALRPEAPLFLSGRGGPMAVRSIQNLIAQLARRAKITRVRVSPHTLRHTFALHYLRQNPGKLVELASLLGHESLDTTALYTRPSIDDLAEDLERSRLNVYG
jgi:integrase/recombinase XerC